MHAIVTGHSRGLGAAIAQCLLARGLTVLGLSRHGNPALAERFATGLSEVSLDLSDPSSLCAALHTAPLKTFLAADGPALLINNAGMLQPVARLGTQDAAAIVRAGQLNFIAPLLLANAFAATGRLERERRIVHVSSGAARSAYAGWSIYGAGKAGLDHHARAVAAEQHPWLRICSLAPGVIDTDMQAEVRASDPADFPQRARFDALKRDALLTPAAIAAERLVDYLLSDAFGRETVADLSQLA